MSVTFIIPIMLGSRIYMCIRAYARALSLCTYARAYTRNSPRRGWRRSAREGRGRERKKERERECRRETTQLEYIPCEYNAEGTYRRFQRGGIDGDLVAGNSPRLTPLFFSSPPSQRGAARYPPLPSLPPPPPPPSLPPSVLHFPSAHRAHCRVSFPFSTLPPAPQGV